MSVGAKPVMVSAPTDGVMIVCLSNDGATPVSVNEPTLGVMIV